MHKYYVFFIQNIHDFLVYRLRLFIIVLSSFIAPLVMIWIFSGLPGNQINGMTKEQLISYYLVTSLLFVFMNSKIDYFVKEAIQQGELAIYLLKPIQFWSISLVKDISGRMVRLVFGIPIFLLFAFLYRHSFVFGSLGDSGVFILMLIISFLLVFLLSFAVGLLAFWLDEVWGLQNLKEVSLILLGGVALPYNFFPEGLRQLLVFSPFPYFINWPLRKGFSGSIEIEFMVSLSWIAIFLLLNTILWRRGLKRYSAMGTY